MHNKITSARVSALTLGVGLAALSLVSVNASTTDLLLSINGIACGSVEKVEATNGNINLINATGCELNGGGSNW